MMSVHLHKIIENTYVAGPGKRYCIWVQGCNRRCAGCLAQETWSETGGYYEDVDKIIRDIKESIDRDAIEGITFLGGEPFQQAQSLSAIGREIKNTGLSVVTFTGYTIEELARADNEGFNDLLAVTDILIDGAFQLENWSLDRPWVGSSNQRYHFLTKRYTEQVLQTKNKLEVRIYRNGKTIVSGMGDFHQMIYYLK